MTRPFRNSTLRHHATTLGAIAALSFTASSTAATITSVQDGHWGSPATWTIGIPGPSDHVDIWHEVWMTSGLGAVSAGSIDVADAWFGTANSLPVTLTGPLQIGTGAGVVESYFVLRPGSTIEASTITVGAGAPAHFDCYGSGITCISAPFRIGADGARGSVYFTNNPTIDGGLLVGADGFLSRSTPPHVTNGDVDLLTGWTLEAAPLSAIGDTMLILTFDGTASAALPQLNNADGFEVEWDTTTPGELRIIATHAPEEHIWQVPGADDWFNTAHWNTGTLPTLGDLTTISNGGEAQISTGTAEARSVQVGTYGGDGALTIMNSLLTTSDSLRIGSPEDSGAPASDITAVVEAVDAFVVLDEHMLIASPLASTGFDSAVIDAEFSMTGGGLLARQIRIGSAWAHGSASRTTSSTVAFNDVSEIVLQDGLSLFDGYNETTGVFNHSASVTISGVPDFKIGGSLRILANDRFGDGAGTYESSLDIADTNLIGTEFLLGDAEVYGGSLDSVITANIEDSICAFGRTLRIATVGGNSGSADFDHALSITNSRITVGEYAAGTDTSGTSTLRGALTLRRSYLATDPTHPEARGGRLELGAGSEVTFVIEGADRITPETIGAPNQYATMEVVTGSASGFDGGGPSLDVKAELGGALHLAFEHPSIAAGDTFDLIVASGIVPLTGDFASVSATGLPGGLAAYGNIVDGPVGLSIYQVTVTCPGDFDGSGTINFNDLLIVLQSWGACDGCVADLNDSGAVDFNDLLVLLTAWGQCS